MAKVEGAVREIEDVLGNVEETLNEVAAALSKHGYGDDGAEDSSDDDGADDEDSAAGEEAGDEADAAEDDEADAAEDDEADAAEDDEAGDEEGEEGEWYAAEDLQDLDIRGLRRIATQEAGYSRSDVRGVGEDDLREMIVAAGDDDDDAEA